MHNPNISNIYGSLIGVLTSGTFNAFEKHSCHLFYTFLFLYFYLFNFGCIGSSLLCRLLISMAHLAAEHGV